MMTHQSNWPSCLAWTLSCLLTTLAYLATTHMVRLRT